GPVPGGRGRRKRAHPGRLPLSRRTGGRRGGGKLRTAADPRLARLRAAWAVAPRLPPAAHETWRPQALAPDRPLQAGARQDSLSRTYRRTGGLPRRRALEPAATTLAPVGALPSGA